MGKIEKEIRITIFMVLLLVLATPLVAAGEKGVVTYVFDGDTIAVGGERVRLIGIDAPEVGSKKYGKKEQCFGRQAKEYLEGRLLGKKVRLVYDRQGDRYDKYHRLLAYVTLKGQLINAVMLKEGYARLLWDFPFSKRKEFLKLQNEAIAKRRGYWGSCIPILSSGDTIPD